MVAIAISGFLIGVTLSLRFRVFVLVPVTLSALAVIAVGEGLRGESIWWIALASLLTATSVQAGYLIGGLLQLAVDEGPGELNAGRGPPADPTAALEALDVRHGVVHRSATSLNHPTPVLRVQSPDLSWIMTEAPHEGQ